MNSTAEQEMDGLDQNTLTVSKANGLIQGRQSLTLNEQRLVVLAAAQLDPEAEMPTNGLVRVEVGDFSREFGIPIDGAYKEVQAAARRLYERSVVLREQTRRGEAERTVRLVWSAAYQEGEGAIVLGFTPQMAPYLTQLSKRISHTTMPVRMLGRLSSTFAFRLYELAAVHKTAGSHRYNLTQVREMFGVEGKYDEWRDLYRVVLKPAVDMVNQETDLRVTLKPWREQRKYVAVDLFVKAT